MEIQKVFSDLYSDERLYSVLLTEEEMYLFSELADDAAAASMGTTAALGALGAGAATGYGIKRGAEALANRGRAKRVAAYEAAMEDALSKSESVKAARKKYMDTKAMIEKFGKNGNVDAWEPYLENTGKSTKAVEKAAREAIKKEGNIKIAKAGGVEKAARRIAHTANKATGYLKNNKKVAGALAVGTLGAGAATGYGVHKYRGRND